MTGSEALDFADLATMASEILGRRILREVVSDEDYRAEPVAHGLPAVMADGLGSLYKAARGQEFAVVDSTLERVIGRKPVAMRDVLREFLLRV